MTPIVYRWTVWGLAAEGQTWTATGEARATPGRLVEVTDAALADAFEQLTQGRAVYGLPGLGCHGPYVITRFEIVREDPVR